MQPLAENFFKHGYNKDEEFNLILVNGRVEKEQFVIEFIDNGNWIDETDLENINQSLIDTEDISTENIGLKNVYQRLNNFYGDDFNMKVINNEESGISVRVYIKKNSTGGEYVL